MQESQQLRDRKQTFSCWDDPAKRANMPSSPSKGRREKPFIPQFTGHLPTGEWKGQVSASLVRARERLFGSVGKSPRTSDIRRFSRQGGQFSVTP